MTAMLLTVALIWGGAASLVLLFFYGAGKASDEDLLWRDAARRSHGGRPESLR
jgi:hypothetical protein